MKRVKFVMLLATGILLWGWKGSVTGMPVKVIVLDAGHGGKDPGAVGYSGSYEKNVTLAIVLKVQKMLNEKYPELTVLQTRDSDTAVELNSRAAFAHKNHADLFISIHCNASTILSASGTEVYVMGLDKENANLNIAKAENAAILYEKNYENNYEGFDPSSPEAYIMFSLYQNAYLKQSIQFASLLDNEFKQLRRANRGIRQAAFLVLWKTTMPSVLIETGFITNQTEETYLNSDKGQDELSVAIVNAISKLVDEHKDSAEQTFVKKDTIKERNVATVQNIGKSVDTSTVKKEGETKNKQTTTIIPPSAASASSETVSQSTPPQSGNVLYRVRFFSSRTQYATTDKRFQSLPSIEFTYSGEYYRYTSGKFATYAQAVNHLAKVKKAGFSDAFIVAQHNGELISIEQAKEIEKENQ
jgi:N-acetylmuramoyl-L-alanine amidase